MMEFPMDKQVLKQPVLDTMNATKMKETILAGSGGVWMISIKLLQCYIFSHNSTPRKTL